jgi:rootletin
VKLDETREDEMRKEVFGQKQRVVETEASRDILKKELSNLQRKYAELEDEIRQREKEFRATVDDCKRIERKATEERRNVELALEGANNALSDLRIQLSGADGRISALEAHVARVEGAKKDAEFKLSSIVSSLRRTIGFKPSTVIKSRQASRSPPRRNRSPPLKGYIERRDPFKQSSSRSPLRDLSPDDRSVSPVRYESNV